MGSTTGTTFSQSSLSPGTYYFHVVAKDAAGNVSGDSAEVTAVVADRGAPTTPEGVTARASGSSVTVMWSASSDDVAVEGYDVYRASAPDTATTAATLVGHVTGLSFTQSSVAPGTYYYRVVAVDSGGNRSAASPDAQVSTSTPTTVVAVTASSDAWANQGAPTANVGSDSSLSSRGTPGAVSYLRYTMPTAPAGTTLLSASFTFRTTTLSSAGSVESHTLRQSADSWTESGLTWNTRPALIGPVLGTLPSGTAPNTSYSAPLDAAALSALLGGQASFGITNAGTDSLFFWSRNYTRAADRPQLVLTFG